MKFVRANYPFASDRVGELSFLEGQILLVIQSCDENWLLGRLKDKTGTFPASFVSELPEISGNQQLYLAIRSFPAEEIDDLPFAKGDFVVGFEKVDSNWGRGSCNDKTGIFPFTHVTELVLQDYGSQQPLQIDKADSIQVPSSSVPSDYIAIAQANMDLQAQLPEELSFRKGDMVNVIRIEDEDFALGEVQGRTGQFPIAFVDLLKGELDVTAFGVKKNKFRWWENSENKSSNNQTHSSQSFSTENVICSNGTSGPAQPDSQVLSTETVDSQSMSTVDRLGSSTSSYTAENTDVSAYAIALYPFIAENPNELTFFEAELVQLTRHVDDQWLEGVHNGKLGIFPRSYVDIIVDCGFEDASCFDSGQDSTAGAESRIENMEETYGLVLFDFKAETADDLDLREGDTVTIIRKVDENWFEACHDDGRIGFCPANYLDQIQSSCPSTPLHSCLDDDKKTEMNGKNVMKSLPYSFSIDEDQSPPELRRKPAKPLAKPDLSNMSSRSVFPAEQPISAAVPQQPNSLLLEAKLPPPPRPAPMQIGKKLPPQRPAAPSGLSSQEGRNLRPKPVPQRKAPPRPGSKNMPDSNLMEFSPKSSEEEQAIAQLEAELQRLTAEMQSYEESAAEATRLTGEVETDQERALLADNVDRMQQMTASLRSRAGEVEDALCRAEPWRLEARQQEEMRLLKVEEARRAHELEERQRQTSRRKQRESRENVIDELIATERDFAGSLALCCSAVLHDGQLRDSVVDVSLLCGNIDQVMAVSKQLLALLEQQQRQDFEEVRIGSCFVGLHEELKSVYALYCKNHDDVIHLLEKYQKDEEAAALLQMRLLAMREHQSVFDIGAMLIKPVQRILKYPLLLNQLSKHTETSHPDHFLLAQAQVVMTDVATAINEVKRRKDLVLKYKREADTKLAEKFSRINMHSTKKKIMRISQKMAGVHIVDEKFIELEKKFGYLDKATRGLVKNVATSMDVWQNLCDTQESVAHDFNDCFGADEVRALQLCTSHHEISTLHFLAMKQQVEDGVLVPLSSLLQLFQEPFHLIKKRQDKLLDYENATNRTKSAKDNEQLRLAKEEHQMAQQNYEALNAQLLDELPKLCQLSQKLLRLALSHFISYRKEFFHSSTQLLMSLTESPLVEVTGLSKNPRQVFDDQHALMIERLSALSFAPRSFNPKADEARHRTKLAAGPAMSSTSIGAGASASAAPTAQSKADGDAIVKKYPGKCFRVLHNVSANKPLDLSLAGGSIVGVIKEGDPMGNKSRWYVDTGSEAGFVLSKVLIPCAGEEVDSPEDLIALSSPVEGKADLKSPEKAPRPDREQEIFRAVYAFTARSDLEVSLRDGESVIVIQKCDQEGNSEWWYVKTEHGEGYVPASYLYQSV